MVRELDLGGSERQLAEIAKALDRERFEPHVGCFRANGSRGAEHGGALARRVGVSAGRRRRGAAEPGDRGKQDHHRQPHRQDHDQRLAGDEQHAGDDVPAFLGCVGEQGGEHVASLTDAAGVDRKRALGAATATETIERALDLVVFQHDLVEGTRAMLGVRIASPDSAR